MPTFKPYVPEQEELLPRDVRSELGEDHLCFLIHEMVEEWDVSSFVACYSDAGGESPYHPRLMLKVWLYAFALGVKSTRKLERRIIEDLAFRYLAGHARPDHKTLSEFQRKHGEAIRELFAQVMALVRAAGMGQLGTVAIDSTRIKASASRERVLRERDLKRVLEWQQQLEDDPDRTPGTQLSRQQYEQVREQLKRLQAAGESKLSETDPEARFLRERQGSYVLGYSAELAVSDDHFIVAVNVSQRKIDTHGLLPMIEQIEHECGQVPRQVLADTGFYSPENLIAVEARGIDAYIPDPYMAKELKGGGEAKGFAGTSTRTRCMREKLRSPQGRALYRRRKSLVEPVFGVLKEHRGMRQFQRRGLAKATVELTLAALAFNLTRLHNLRRAAH